MLRILLTCLAAASLTLAVAACGDDDDGQPSSASGTPTEEPGDGRTSPPTANVTPGDDDDHKTEGPSESPGIATPVPTAPGPTPTAPPVAAEGTPAPEAPESFIVQFQGMAISYSDCSYDPNTRQVTCHDVIYAIDPPMAGQDVTCQEWVVNNVPEAISCISQEPLNSKVYEIPN